MVSGRRRLSWYVNIEKRMFLTRTTSYASCAGSLPRRRSARWSRDGTGAMYVGERCSIVTFAADFAMDGTSVTAVAPLPMITTCLPS